VTSSASESRASSSRTARALLPAHQRRDAGGGESGAEDAGGAEHAARLGALAADARLDDGEDALGELDAGAGGDGADDLLEAERVAGAARDDAGDAGFDGGVAERAADERLGGVARELREA
jgi:hypothetical protein